MTPHRPSSLDQLPDVSFLEEKTVLVTGGTGSFGRRFVATVLAKTRVKKIIVFSRDELKQSEMAPLYPDPRLRFFLGDIRDAQRLSRAFEGVDYVVHAAALKQVPALEYNPFEAVLTNVMAAQNIVDAALDRGVQRVVALSTDKAVNPVNLYGATKLCFEKLFVAGNSYAAGHKTRYSVVRYGNVVGSRGSVIPLYLKKRKEGVLPVTDERMTRFWITLDQGVNFVLQALEASQGGEIFVPKIPSMKVVDLAKAIGPGCTIKNVGIRPGEKLHECLLTEDEAHRTLDLGHLYLVQPNFPWWGQSRWPGKPVDPSFRYSSDGNDSWLTTADLTRMVESFSKQDGEAVAA